MKYSFEFFNKKIKKQSTIFLLPLFKQGMSKCMMLLGIFKLGVRL